MYQIDLECKKGETFSQTLTLQDSAGGALDLDGYSAQCQIRNGDTLIADTLVSIEGNNIKIELTAAQTNAMEVGNYDYDLAMKKLDVVSYIIGGKFSLKPAVTVINSIVTDGVALWGQIKGSISLQTDLQSALDTKADAIDTENALSQKAAKTDVTKSLSLKADTAEVSEQISNLTNSIRDCDTKCDTKLDKSVINYQVYTYSDDGTFPISFSGESLTVVSAYIVQYGRLRYFNLNFTATAALTASTSYVFGTLAEKVLPNSGYTSGNVAFSSGDTGTTLSFVADKAYTASGAINVSGLYLVEETNDN
jgi:hypothetical protein